MAKDRGKYNVLKTRVLADLREKARISQEQAAKYFELKDRNTIAAWELGYSRPNKKHRAAFIVYLWDKLKLSRDSQQFHQVWNDVMEDEWGWDALTTSELPDSHSDEDVVRRTLTLPPLDMSERLSSYRRVSKKVGNEPDRDRLTIGKATFKHIKPNPKNTEITAVRPINQVTETILDSL